MKLPTSLAKTASRTAFLALVAVSLVPAQSLTPSKFDVDVDAGAQLFKKRPDPLETKLLNAPVFGFHLTENIWNYWSLEEGLEGSTSADLTLLTPIGTGFGPRVDLGQRVWKLNVNPVFHFTPNGSRFRPFLTAGFAEEMFVITNGGKNTAAALVPGVTYKSDYKPAFNYGGGLKIRFTNLIGMRFDVRGYWSGGPTWGLPNIPTVPAGGIYIPTGGSLHGMDATAGILFTFGGRKAAPAHAPEAPPAKVEPPPPPARVFELSPIQCSPTSGYVDDVFNCTTTLTDSAHAPGDTIHWSVDGADQGPGGASLRLSNLSPGNHVIKVTASDPATGVTATVPSTTITVRERPLPPLTVSGITGKSPIKFGETDNLSAQGSDAGRCNPLTYTWTTDIGSIRGSGPNVVFDSSTVAFDPANVFKSETRTATITVTVTDTCGRTATSAAFKILITKDPKAMRLDDLIFGKGASRVNNCAKRILLDELQAIMNNNPDVEVLLVGHIDASEPSKGPKGRPLALDHQRVYNAAAVLTAGTGVCAKADLSRIKVAFAGTDQTSESKAGFCGTSTRQKSDERKQDEIAADDEAAKNRRVEIWIIPQGVAMPPGVTNPEPAPANIIKAKGCPH